MPSFSYPKLFEQGTQHIRTYSKMPAPKRPSTIPQNWEPEENAVLLYFRSRRFPYAAIRDVLNLRFGRESRIIAVVTKLADITDREANAGQRPFYDKTAKIKESDLKLVYECISSQMDPAFLWTKG